MADDLVTVRWAYRPDDRKKQGKTEKLPRDLASLKVREGLAVLVEEPPADSVDASDGGVEAAGGKATKAPRAASSTAEVGAKS